MSQRILVPLDGSPLSKKALRTALDEYPEAEITVLHVIDPTEPGYSYPHDADLDLSLEPLHGSEEWYERAREAGEALFDEAREIAAEYGGEIETETVVGDPARVIVQYAEDQDVDHILLGSHAREADSRILLGSVTEGVAFRAHARVSIVR